MYPSHPPSPISLPGLRPRPQRQQTRLHPPSIPAPGTSKHFSIPPRQNVLLRADFHAKGFGEEAAREPLVQVRAGEVGGGHEGTHVWGC